MWFLVFWIGMGFATHLLTANIGYRLTTKHYEINRFWVYYGFLWTHQWGQELIHLAVWPFSLLAHLLWAWSERRSRNSCRQETQRHT